ncbi:MAG: PEP-CTERM sorting domain-containing protein [Microcystis aeruginosa Ma_QC_C_20070703_M131]|uniref:PEP-CTERM sorting domain-containing protein n=2 Tax=Microcystis aeruginosa TaxID=1126 RepID=A0A551XZT3_MICAE|nr:MAG: PEP-CTERM sorting domain-containing protein [Microcystis aeruginosa Ma_QC_C_20070703_M131]
MTNFLSTTCDDCTGDGYVRIELIPEPSSILSLLALGTLGAASTFKRKLKPSKSSEKETTKIR